MSEAHSHHPAEEHPVHVPGTDDDVNIGKIVIIGVVSLLIFALSAVVAHLILRRDEAELQRRGVAPLMRGLAKRQEIGIIDNIPFDADGRLDRWRAEKARALNSYGWVDRQKGVIHIPVEEAMKEVVRQAASAGGAR
jgi:hypothetical protein